MDRLEEKAWIRAVDGRAKPIYQGGRLVGTVQEYSDGLMVTLLKAHPREKYRENFEVKHAASDPLAALMRQIRDRVQPPRRSPSSASLPTEWRRLERIPFFSSPWRAARGFMHASKRDRAHLVH